MDGYIGKGIKAVFFDLDDTLLDTIEAKWAEHKFIAKKYYNKDLSDNEIKLHWGKPLTELMLVLYDTDDAKKAHAHNEAEHEKYPKKIKLHTIPLFKSLKQSGKLTGIITATNRFSYEHDTRKHGLDEKLVDYTQTQEDTPFHKPDPRVFEPAVAWLKQHNISPTEVLYVGDGLQDMKAALGAGFKFIGVETGLVTAKEFFRHNKQKSLPHIGHLKIK